ncbi:MAG: DUF4743 domain-containing protein [Gammaproteobacteria bacterium]
MSFRDRIREANRHDIHGFRVFRVAGQRVGFIRHAFAERLRHWPAVFAVTAHEVRLASALDHGDTPATERSAAVQGVIEKLYGDGLFQHWRGERYAVNRAFTDPPLLAMERAAIPLFGVCGYGVHLNGYVRTPDGLKMWIGRRALNKPTAPGKLDQLVAGGQPVGIGLQDNLIKECAEEAAIPAELAARALPVGAVSYCLEVEHGLRPDVLFNYDLELPPDFVPVNTDGEVEEFFLWPIEQVINTVRDSEDFKFNCALVVIDFLIRHGLIAPDHPDYIDLLSGLRQREIIFARIAD